MAGLRAGAASFGGSSGAASTSADGRETLPSYLRSAEDFRAYMEDQFDGLDTKAKGDYFAACAVEFLRKQAWSANFPNIRANPKASYELGRDIFSDADEDGAVLYGQAKYSPEGTDDLDTTLSKWMQAEAAESEVDGQGKLFGDERRVAAPTYVYASGRPLSATIARYESQRHRAARPFYDRLMSEGRFRYVDLDEIYNWIRNTHLRQNGMASNFSLNSSNGWITVGEVYLGVVDGKDVADLLDSNGESLFFENIRGWLGEHTAVNTTIAETVASAPDKFLERNNGITLRAESAKISDDQSQLIIARGNIINGCQTTMTIWQQREHLEGVKVQVKVIGTPATDEAWKIAESANFQNDVTLVELKLAQHLRPQKVRRHASEAGRVVSGYEPTDLERVLKTLGADESNYEFVRHLFMGLFSRKPTNLFADNYERLSEKRISEYYRLSEDAENILFGTLFVLIDHTERALAALSPVLSEVHSSAFERIVQPSGVKYRAFIALLAASVFLQDDVAVLGNDASDEAVHLKRFLEKLSDRLAVEPETFVTSCKIAVQVVSDDSTRDNEDERSARQHFSSRIGQADFVRLFNSGVRLTRLFAGS